MVAISPVAHKLLNYVPFLLVLIDLRYEGKRSVLLFKKLFLTSFVHLHGSYLEKLTLLFL